MNLDLSDKHALVCGSSRGIGQAVARALAQLGARVTALARNRDGLEGTLASLARGHGQTHAALAIDLADSEALEQTLRDWIGAAGPVHVLVNNSGGPPAGPAHSAEPEAFQQAFTQHLVADQILVRALLPGMRTAGYGRIVNIISTSVKEPIPELGVSNTIRGAVASWAKTLATELAPHGITVNNLLPGFTDTERLAYLFENKARKTGQSVEAVRAAAQASIPMGRFATPEEIASAVAFLASPAASYVNGINLTVDGGRTHSL